MARLIYRRDSTQRHKRMARRHSRLCRKIPGADSLGKDIQLKLEVLVIKEKETEEAEEVCEDALDDVTLKATELDIQVHNAFETIMMYDRNNLSQFTDVLFPTHRFTDITNLPPQQKVLEAAKLIKKIESIATGLNIESDFDMLMDSVTALNTALEVRRKSLESLAKYQTAEELARNDVRTQYEMNYLEARKRFGKLKAEMLFPKITTRPSKSDKEDPEPDTEA